MIFIFWIVLTFVLAHYGSHRKIGYWGTFFLSLLLSPIIGLIAVALSDRIQPPIKAHVVENLPWENSTSSSNGKSVSLADELEKLKKLHDEGHITDEEFAKMKQKLIS